MISVKMRVKYFYAASEIILLLRENNRPSGVKGCFQETVLSTPMSAFLDRKERTGANTVDSCTMLRLGLSTLHSWKSACSFPLYSRPFWPFTTTDSRKGHGKQGFLPRLESTAENPRFGIRGQESMVGNVKLVLDLCLCESLIWQKGLTEGNVFMDHNPRGGPTLLNPSSSRVNGIGNEQIHIVWTVLPPWTMLRLKAFFFNRKLSR